MSSYFSQCAYVILEHRYIIVIIVVAIFVVLLTLTFIVVVVVLVIVLMLSIIFKILFVIIYILKQGQTPSGHNKVIFFIWFEHFKNPSLCRGGFRIAKELPCSPFTFEYRLILMISSWNLKFIKDFTPYPILNSVDFTGEAQKLLKTKKWSPNMIT